MAQSGSSVLLLVEDPPDSGTYIEAAKQTDYTHSGERNMIETTAKQDDHENHVYGKKGDTVDVDHLWVSGDAGQSAIQDAVNNKNEIKVRKEANGNAVKEADAKIESFEESQPDNDSAEFTASLVLQNAFTTV